MSLCNPVGRDKSEVACYIGGGTFSANPLTMTAGLATLKHVKQNKSAIYPKINKIGTRVRKGLKKAFSDGGVDVDVTGIGSLFMTHFLNKDIRKISSASDVGLSDRDLLRKYHFALIAKHNMFFLPEKMGAISSMHSLKDADHLIDATHQIVQSRLLSPSK
jgi:glutamate-1-semialdehyde 2,1-aminomutase